MNEQKISWKRSDLKWRGKQAFKKNYWSAVLVSLVLAIVLATGGSGAATGSAGNVASPDAHSGHSRSRKIPGRDRNGTDSAECKKKKIHSVKPPFSAMLRYPQDFLQDCLDMH